MKRVEQDVHAFQLVAYFRDQSVGKLLFRFRESDSEFGISRDALKKIAGTLGVDETVAIHLALAHLRHDLLPRYESDDGPLTSAQLRDARSLAPQDRIPTSSLFGTTD